MKPYFALFLVLLLTTSSLIIVLPIRAQPAQGNWVVTGTQVVENTSINLDGNLTIKSGGSLTLMNVTLTLNPQDSGQSGILAEEGSSFFIYNSCITSATSFRFFFSVVNATFVMKDSELEGAGTGSAWDTDGLRIRADGAVVQGVFIHNGWGIRLAAHNSRVVNCTLETDYGICLPHSQNEQDVPSNNLILGNTILHPIEFGVMTSGHDDEIANNTIIDTEAGASIQSGAGYNNLITGNHIVKEHGPGLWGGIALLGKSYNNTVRGNSIMYDQPPDRREPFRGIEIRYSSYNYIEDNVISGAQIGVMVFYSYSNVIVYNEITNVTYGTAGTDNLYIPSCDAIQLYHASDNLIAGNQLSSIDNNAILLWENSTNNTIQANVVDKAYDGIMLHYSADNNTIVNNALSEIVSWDVVVDESSGNVLYGNNFEDQHVQALDNGRSSWNSSLEGNYWGDYGGIDGDGDGIGDDPYSIPLNGTDWLPSMRAVAIEPFSIPKTQVMDGHLIVDQGRGEQLVVSSSVTWRDVTLDGGGFGVDLRVNSGASLTLMNVTLKLNGFGDFYVDAGASLFIYNSTITASDPMFGGYQIHLRDAKQFVMRDSEIHDGGWGFSIDHAAVVCSKLEEWSAPEESPRIMIENNLFSHNYYSICILTPGDDRVVNNTISYTYMGILTNVAIVDGNRISNVIHAGLVGGDGGDFDPNRSLPRPVFENNIISNCWGAGIRLNKFMKLAAKNNTISDCDEGISASTAWMLPNNAMISGNEITRSKSWGLRIKVYENHPAKITVIDNSLVNCGKGIFLEPMTYGVLLYHNSIINSPNSTDLGDSTWDFGGEGNYWSEYNGIDVKKGPDQSAPGSDGIGDTPHTLEGGGVDRYPLMQPYGSPPPESYTLTIELSDRGTTIPSFGTYEYSNGSQVLVIANPNSGYSFDHWSLDAIENNSNPITVDMGADHNLVPFFLDIAAPVALAGPDQTAKVNSSVFFNATSSYDNDVIVSYTWDFGDDNNGTGSTASHMYVSAGVYVVILTVVDAAGNAGTDTMTVTVEPPTAPDNTLLYVGIGAVAILTIAGLAVVMLKRRK